MSSIDIPSNRMDRSLETDVIAANSDAQQSTENIETLKKIPTKNSSQSSSEHQQEIAETGNDKCLDSFKTSSVSTKNKTSLPQTRSSFMRSSSGNNQSTSKSWYARCNRWRSLSSDRRKNPTLRYSWNTGNNNPM